MIRIHVGCEIKYEFAQPTPMIFMVTIHASRVSDLERPDFLLTTPSVPVEGYRDSFGNWCNRSVAPAGQFLVKTDTVARDTGAWDAFDGGARQAQVQDRPAEPLQFLLESRYCETDRMSEAAWTLFGQTPLGGASVQAICDYVHDLTAFGYEHSRATRSAAEAFEEKRGACRDFAHLEIAFCSGSRIPLLPQHPGPLLCGSHQ